MDEKAIEERIKQIQDEKNYPTPPVGTPVVWHEQAKPEVDYAALVTGIIRPGVVSLAIFKPNSMQMFRSSVTFKGHPQHDQVNNEVSRREGSWGYPKGTKAPPQHYDLAKADKDRRIKGQEQLLEQAIEADTSGTTAVASG